jgi:hypothetical protein
MTTTAKLLANKEEFLRRLEKDPGPNEREEIGRLLEKINTALDLLDGPTSSLKQFKTFRKST